MSHMLGHWQDEGGGSVGAARLKPTFGKLIPHDEKDSPITFEGEPLQIICLNNRNYTSEGKEPGKDGYHKVGFHLAVIPFENQAGEEVGNFLLAYDVIDYGEHEEAEEIFNEFVNPPVPGKRIESFPSDTIRDIAKKLHEGKFDTNVQAKFGLEKPELDEKKKSIERVLKQTADFLETSSFKKVTKGDPEKNKGEKWITDEVKNGRIVNRSDVRMML